MPNFSKPELWLSTEFNIIRPDVAQTSPLHKFIPHFLKNSVEATAAVKNSSFFIQGVVNLAHAAPYNIMLVITGTESVVQDKYMKSVQFLRKVTSLSGSNVAQSTDIPFELELSAVQCPDSFAGEFGKISYELSAIIQQPDYPRSICSQPVNLIYRPNSSMLLSYSEDWTKSKWPITLHSTGPRLLLVHTLNNSQFLTSSFRPVVTFSQEYSTEVPVFEIEQVHYTLIEVVKYKRKNKLGIEHTVKNSTEIIRGIVYDTPCWDEPCLLELYDLTDAMRIHQPTNGKLLSVSHYLKISIRFMDMDDYVGFKLPIHVVVTQ
ncbi:hypothetical protein HDV04_005665 [Boothiomyces sp. JEL0838]|nr:hypothetical protein HDV04_005665 [Boothiomyces sp. JEL0838]